MTYELYLNSEDQIGTLKNLCSLFGVDLGTNNIEIEVISGDSSCISTGIKYNGGEGFYSGNNPNHACWIKTFDGQIEVLIIKPISDSIKLLIKAL